MSRPIGDYVRPTQTWRCGGEDSGRPCRRGPDARGRCQAETECLAFFFGGEVSCRRTPEQGGPCAGGPDRSIPGPNKCPRRVPPCRPVRTLRAWRRLVVRSVLALTVVLVAIALLGPGRRRFVDPGPLRPAHGAIGDDCQACHAVAAGGLAGWLERPSLGSDHAGDDSLRCLACHDLGPVPFEAHGRPAVDLAAATARRSAAGEGGASPVGELACAICHTEHRGPIDPRDRSAAWCQSCHAGTFAAFDDGHPGFGSYPHAEPTGIAFSHQAHEGDHHLVKSADFVCADCHRPAGGGARMETVGFEDGCAGCHAAGLSEIGEIYLFRPPRLDLDALPGIGQWPRRAKTMEGGQLPPIPHALLGPAAAGDLDGVRLDALDEVGPEGRASADRLAWGLKGLLADLDARGDAALAERLAVDRDRLDRLAGRFPPDLPRSASDDWRPHVSRLAATWFGELASELEARGAGRAVPSVSVRDRLEVDRDRAAGPGWALVADGVAYRPRGHADPTIVAWLEVLAAAPGDAFDRLAAGKPARSCLECHLADGRRIAWRGARWSFPDRPVSRFDHASHRTETCDSCHARSPDLAIGLAPVERARCLDCHLDGGAPQGCPTCHLYHVVEPAGR